MSTYWDIVDAIRQNVSSEEQHECTKIQQLCEEILHIVDQICDQLSSGSKPGRFENTGTASPDTS